MTNRFIFGQYRPYHTLGHKLDPRGKLLFAAGLMVISILTSSAMFYGLIIAGILILLLSSGMSFFAILQNARPFILLVVITALYHLVFSARDTAMLLNVLGWKITIGGLYMALSFSLRVLVFIGIAFFISLTTAPADIAEAMVGWLKPFKKIGVPVYDIGLIIFIAMRFIPVLAEEFETIRKAQQVRGVDFSGKLFQRAKKLIFLLLPVFQSALRRADELAIAIESRGFISGADRSSFRQFKWRSFDTFFFAGALLLVILLYIVSGKQEFNFG